MTTPFRRGDFSQAILGKMQSITLVKTNKEFRALWMQERARVKAKQRETPARIKNPGYLLWKQKLTLLYRYSAKMRGFPDVTRRNPLPSS